MDLCLASSNLSMVTFVVAAAATGVGVIAARSFPEVCWSHFRKLAAPFIIFYHLPFKDWTNFQKTSHSPTPWSQPWGHKPWTPGRWQEEEDPPMVKTDVEDEEEEVPVRADSAGVDSASGWESHLHRSHYGMSIPASHATRPWPPQMMCRSKPMWHLMRRRRRFWCCGC